MKRDAEISDCGRYRYSLTREWDETKPAMLWVMLNPSTADGKEDDPTIRRCIGFAKQWGFGSLEVVNLFALRATDPKDVDSCPDRNGPENWVHLGKMNDYGTVVVAWGANKTAEKFVRTWEKVPSHLKCLGTTKSGAPKHPLYIPKKQILVPWTRELTNSRN